MGEWIVGACVSMLQVDAAVFVTCLQAAVGAQEAAIPPKKFGESTVIAYFCILLFGIVLRCASKCRAIYARITIEST